MTLGIPERIDHEEAMASVMPYIWEDKPIASGYVRALGASLQDIEDTCHSILAQDNLYAATGASLDTIGLILNEDRDGRLDPAYRTALLTKTSVNESSGTTRDIKRVSKAVTGATVAKVFSHKPLCTYVFVNAPVNRVEAEAIETAHMATVRTRVIWSNEDNFVRTLTLSGVSLLYAECGEEEMECGAEIAECGGSIDTGTSGSLPYGGGFTSLVEGATGYDIVDDDKGSMCSIASNSDADVSTGLIVDNEGNYIVFDDGSYMRYII